jgi:pimeloyl-ACP methyl ester carboxylesterase
MDWLGVSLSCEFVALAAVERPERVAHLALVSPTGLGKRLSGSYIPGATREIAWLKGAIKGRSWSKPLFNGLTRPGTIRFFLNKTWGSKAIDETLLDYCIKTTRVPGAEHAPLSFVSASMFTRGIHEVYAKLRMPVWVAHGTKGDFTDYEGIRALGPPAHWTVKVFEAGALPYFEHPKTFMPALEAFLNA